jgi:hypothetical protein
MLIFDDDDLIALAFDELSETNADALRANMASDPALAARYAAIVRDLEQLAHTPAPEPDDMYGRRVWARIEPELADRAQPDPAPRTVSSRGPYGWAVAASLALVAVIAFQMGRMNRDDPAASDPQVAEVGPAVATPDRAGRSVTSQRVLAATVADHLQGTERLLLQIANQEPGGDVDIDAERQWASVLLMANRLYRYAAEQAGQERVAQVLSDIEPVLIQLANGEGADASDELRGLRHSIAERDLIFKARTTEVQL